MVDPLCSCVCQINQVTFPGKFVKKRQTHDILSQISLSLNPLKMDTFKYFPN